MTSKKLKEIATEQHCTLEKEIVLRENKRTTKKGLLFLEKYYSNINDIVIYIGPHNKVCCYEIGEELKRKFSEHYKFKQNNNAQR